MTIAEYDALIAQNGFEEHPLFNDGTQLLSRFLLYSDMDTDLKIYISRLILCRSFYGTYTPWYDDVNWFIENFFNDQQTDYIKPELTGTIKCAASMVLSENHFTEGIIGTTFMFGVLEFYAKHKLGFRPRDYDFFDRAGKKEYLNQMDVHNKRQGPHDKARFRATPAYLLPIAIDLNLIDNYTTSRLNNAGITSERWNVHSIADRLNLARNPMLHGETHSFYRVGAYLLMLYALFHLHDRKAASAAVTATIQ